MLGFVNVCVHIVVEVSMCVLAYIGSFCDHIVQLGFIYSVYVDRRDTSGPRASPFCMIQVIPRVRVIDITRALAYGSVCNNVVMYMNGRLFLCWYTSILISA